MKRAMASMAAGLAVAVTAVALAGCGSVSAPGGASTTATTATTPTREPGQAGAEALARHDRLFPQVAAKCAGVAATPPSAPAAAPTGDGGTWADKYAENHAYKQTVRLLADAQCRGEAHAARIADALRPAGTSAAVGEAGLRAALQRLGYPAELVDVHTSAGTPGFDLEIPEAVLCVSGLLTARPDIHPHGMYLDGGCTEPKGGH
ncbi:hypothetical protein ACFVTF_36855 [Kitasatospora sp. NPDC057940]|uniref:hypothetical protein n=1 Tax=Kitasatospora sp. NPDC057940 TaxID=3346285 RepID=UPI0036DBD5D8